VLTLIIQIKKKKKEKTMMSQKDHMKVEERKQEQIKNNWKQSTEGVSDQFTT
jgi:hypothetical protein